MWFIMTLALLLGVSGLVCFVISRCATFCLLLFGLDKFAFS